MVGAVVVAGAVVLVTSSRPPVVVVAAVVVVVAVGSTPTPARLTLKSSPSLWLFVSLMVKLEVSLNEPTEPGENV